MGDAARRTGAPAGARGDAVHPARAEARDLLDGALGRDAQKAAVIAAGQDEIGPAVRRKAEHGSAMRGHCDGRRVGVEEAHRPVAETRRDARAG